MCVCGRLTIPALWRSDLVKGIKATLAFGLPRPCFSRVTSALFFVAVLPRRPAPLETTSHL